MSTADPLVTVVVPAYEAAASVRETVDSVLAQTFRDFELLVVDDGSRRFPVPDDLPEDPRLRVIRRPRNGGYARVTNQAVELARGEWMTWVDADDTVAPTYLERLLDAAGRTGAHVVLTPMIRFSAGSAIGRGPWNPPSEVMDTRTAIRALVRGDLLGTQHLLLHRPRPVAPEDQVYSDFPFVLAHVARSETVACVDEPLYRNVMHAGSVTGSLRPGVWDLVTLNELVRPLVEEAFDPHDAADLLRAHRDLSLTQLLHAAAHEPEDSPLRREVTAWCRNRITLRGILTQLREGNRMAAGSWSLAKASAPLHRRAYRLYDARRRQAA